MRRRRIHAIGPLAGAFMILWTLSAAAHDAAESCWSREDVCVIRATLQRPLPSTAVALPMEIDCLHLADSASEDAINEAYSLRPAEIMQQVILDGCHTPPFRTTTYGFEMLPGCDQINKVTVERFRGDMLQNIYCGGESGTHHTNVQVLLVRNNEISSLTANSLTNLTSLRELLFSGNSLRHIENETFDALPVLKRLQLQQEHMLSLKQSDVFERTVLTDVCLTSLKRVAPQLFQHLPRTLRSLNVAHTPIDAGAVTMINPQQVCNASLIDCGLRAFTLIDGYASVLLLNLSGNVIEELRWEMKGRNATDTALQLLDLTENRLSHLKWHWLRPLTQLRQLLLRGNLLKTLSLSQLLTTTPTIQLIDLRDNKLVALRDTALQLHYYLHTRIQIDRNPWNCLWLLNFAHAHPEKFRIFQYDKFISQINVNGLACHPEETLPADFTLYSTEIDEATQNQLAREKQALPPTEATLLNVSTYTLVYGNPWDYKRNQRAEALIIVFMLPLGIAFLFLLLYMWIHCQRIFHLSYYRSFPLIGIHHTSNGPLRSADRFDVVRQLPSAGSATVLTGPNSNEGYEMPLNGMSSPTCNCPNHATANGGVGSKCQKPHHHITYVAIPTEQPYKIYEEILEEPSDAHQLDAEETDSTQHTALYDHLSFVDPAINGDM